MRTEGSFNTNITSSQWVALETLSEIFKGCLALFPEGITTPFPISWPKANLERIRLWEFLKEKVFIEYMMVERVFIRYEKVVLDAIDLGIKTRSLQCDIALHQKHGIGLPVKVEPFLALRIGMDLLADCDDWHVRKIYFLPFGDQSEKLIKEEMLEFKIV